MPDQAPHAERQGLWAGLGQGGEEPRAGHHVPQCGLLAGAVLVNAEQEEGGQLGELEGLAALLAQHCLSEPWVQGGTLLAGQGPWGGKGIFSSGTSCSSLLGLWSRGF